MELKQHFPTKRAKSKSKTKQMKIYVTWAFRKHHSFKRSNSSRFTVLETWREGRINAGNVCGMKANLIFWASVTITACSRKDCRKPWRRKSEFWWDLVPCSHFATEKICKVTNDRTTYVEELWKRPLNFKMIWI